jgi:RHS repeat-associated protein
MGSVVALSDDDGNIVESYSYDVFGKPNTESTIGNPFIFACRRYDNETGLYYYRARHYNPDIGRFLQADPIGYADGLNLYTYCGNNPLNYTDPYGLSKEAIEDAIADALRDMSERFDQFLSMHPRFEKFWQGRYFGTGYGDQAADWYVQRFLESDTIIGKVGYGLGGGLASLWLPESWKITALTLGTAGGKIVAKTNVAGAIEPTHIGYKFLGKNIIHYGRHIPFGRHLGLLPGTGKNALIHLYGNRLFFSLGKVQFTLPHSQTAIFYTGYAIGGHEDQ